MLSINLNLDTEDDEIEISEEKDILFEESKQEDRIKSLNPSSYIDQSIEVNQIGPEGNVLSIQVLSPKAEEPNLELVKPDLFL